MTVDRQFPVNKCLAYDRHLSHPWNFIGVKAGALYFYHYHLVQFKIRKKKQKEKL